MKAIQKRILITLMVLVFLVTPVLAQWSYSSGVEYRTDYAGFSLFFGQPPQDTANAFVRFFNQRVPLLVNLREFQYTPRDEGVPLWIMLIMFAAVFSVIFVVVKLVPPFKNISGGSESENKAPVVIFCIAISLLTLFVTPVPYIFLSFLRWIGVLSVIGSGAVVLFAVVIFAFMGFLYVSGKGHASWANHAKEWQEKKDMRNEAFKEKNKNKRIKTLEIRNRNLLDKEILPNIRKLLELNKFQLRSMNDVESLIKKLVRALGEFARADDKNAALVEIKSLSYKAITAIAKIKTEKEKDRQKITEILGDAEKDLSHLQTIIDRVLRHATAQDISEIEEWIKEEEKNASRHDKKEYDAMKTKIHDWQQQLIKYINLMEQELRRFSSIISQIQSQQRAADADQYRKIITKIVQMYQLISDGNLPNEQDIGDILAKEHAIIQNLREEENHLKEYQNSATRIKKYITALFDTTGYMSNIMNVVIRKIDKDAKVNSNDKTVENSAKRFGIKV
jgi:hypothetical protein